MKTFSIALGRFQLPDDGSALMTGGTAPFSIAEKERADEERAAQEQRFQQAFKEGKTAEDLAAEEKAAQEAAAPAPAAGEPVAHHIGAGDVLEFGIDGDDYSTCVFTAWHPDGSADWVKFNRNGFVQEQGFTPAPPPPEETTVEAGSGGTAASLGAAASPMDSIDVETEEPAEEPAERRGRGRHRY